MYMYSFISMNEEGRTASLASIHCYFPIELLFDILDSATLRWLRGAPPSQSG